jgi:hypothetical protein
LDLLGKSSKAISSTNFSGKEEEEVIQTREQTKKERMEHDLLTSFPSHENLLMLDQTFFLQPPCFSPREVPSCSPRGFLATFAPTLTYLPDAVEWDSTGSVGSRRSSDEFSEVGGAKPTFDWKKLAEDIDATKKHLSANATDLISRQNMPCKKEEPKYFACKEAGCNKVYTTTEGLRLHNRNIHMNDKRHKCEHEGCDRAFVRASDLKLHILRIHQTERPFPCTEPDCTKSFACNSELTRHLNCHSRSKSSRKKLRRASEDDQDDDE